MHALGVQRALVFMNFQQRLKDTGEGWGGVGGEGCEGGGGGRGCRQLIVDIFMING